MRTTDRAGNQAKILAFIREEIQTKGYPPSVREICAAVGFRSPSTVHGYLTELEENGYIHRPSHARSPWRTTRGIGKRPRVSRFRWWEK